MSRIKYILRDGWRLIWRHFGMSLLTVFTAMSVFFVIGATMLFILNIRNVIGTMENQLSIQAYMKPDTDLEAAAKSIKAMRNVRSVKVITKETALERLRARLGNQANAVTLLGANPLPASIEVRVSRASEVSDTARMLMAVPEVDDIVYAGHVAEKLTRLSTFVERFSLVMLIVALAASGVVLFNTIRIAVYSRAEEIDVMMKVGATATYVAFPFVIQGFLLGLTGALAASAALGYSCFRAVACLKDMLPFLTFIESPRLLANLSLVLICCGTVVSLFASLIAVEKFIRKAAKPL
ncbi:cell division protein FtsX [Cloacibacillus evryensis]|uniref:cell division protein FtsX n=1 Tax=Cloacibacillus evryensis TaxID=508460 RepID=UPI00267137AA|nr:permease-like cell division protein FtsX [Cloacibacillus evryensis]